MRSSLLPGAGRGVFAIKNFSKGEKVCFYDGYIKKYPTPFENIYKLGDDFVGYYKPRCENGNAQLINDCVKLEFSENDIESTKINNVVDRATTVINLLLYRYAIPSRDGSNVIRNYDSDNGCVWYKAIKDINRGDELYCSYGIDYWLNQSRSPLSTIIFAIEKFSLYLHESETEFGGLMYRFLEEVESMECASLCSALYALEEHKNKHVFQEKFIEIFVMETLLT